jgi:hypothetical protein
MSGGGESVSFCVCVCVEKYIDISWDRRDGGEGQEISTSFYNNSDMFLLLRYLWEGER